MMSSCRRIGLLEGNGAIPVDFFLKSLLPNRLQLFQAKRYIDVLC